MKHERKTQNEERGGDTIEPFLAALLSEENNSKISILILFFSFRGYSVLSVSGTRGRCGHACDRAAQDCTGQVPPRAGGSASEASLPSLLQGLLFQGLMWLRGTEEGLPSVAFTVGPPKGARQFILQVDQRPLFLIPQTGQFL